MTEAEAFFSSSFSADMAKDTAGCITAARKEENCSTVRDACYMKRRRGKGREADNKKVCVGVLVLHVNLIPVFAQTPGSSLFSSSIGKVSASMFSRERERALLGSFWQACTINLKAYPNALAQILWAMRTHPKVYFNILVYVHKSRKATNANILADSCSKWREGIRYAQNIGIFKSSTVCTDYPKTSEKDALLHHPHLATVQSSFATSTADPSLCSLSASSDHVGASFWQWPHHGAVKVENTYKVFFFLSPFFFFFFFFSPWRRWRDEAYTDAM